MSRVILIAVAFGAVLLAQFADRGSARLAQYQEALRSAPANDDAILTGSTRRGSGR